MLGRFYWLGEEQKRWISDSNGRLGLTPQLLILEVCWSWGWLPQLRKWTLTMTSSDFSGKRWKESLSWVDLGCYTAPASHGVPALSRLWRKLRRIDSIAPPKLGLEDDFPPLDQAILQGSMWNSWGVSSNKLRCKWWIPWFGRQNTYINGGTSTKTYQNPTKPWCPASRRENVKATWISGHRSANRIVQKQLQQWMPCENPCKNTRKRIMKTRFYSKTVPVTNSTWTCHMPEVQPSKWLATMYHHILQISGL